VSPRKPKTKKTTGEGESPTGSLAGISEGGRVLVLFEQMQGRFDAVLDSVALNRRVLEDKIEQTRAELKSDIAVLTSAVRRLGEQLERKAEAAEIALLDHRVTALERRAGIAH
jgi:hypothetical protein